MAAETGQLGDKVLESIKETEGKGETGGRAREEGVGIGEESGAVEMRDESESEKGEESEEKTRAGSNNNNAGDSGEVESISLYIFNTSDKNGYESAIVNQQLTRIESLVSAHKSEARTKITENFKSDNVVKFPKQQVVMLKIPKKVLTGSEKKRRPVIVFK